MTDGIEKYSGKGAYKKLAKSMIATTKSSYDPNGSGSAPSVVASTISKAVSTNKPKSRYTTGKHAKKLIYARRLLGDRIFDRIILKDNT